jgi:hypothetical protein
MLPDAALVRPLGLILAVKPLEKSTCPVNVGCHRAFLQPSHA